MSEVRSQELIYSPLMGNGKWEMGNDLGPRAPAHGELLLSFYLAPPVPDSFGPPPKTVPLV